MPKSSPTDKHNESIDNPRSSNCLFSRENLRVYLVATVGILLVIAVYHLFTFQRQRPPLDGGPPSGPGDLPGDMVPINLNQFWPIWGQLFIPSAFEILAGILLFLIFTLTLYFAYKRNIGLQLPLITVFGVALIVLTNLLHGWDVMASSIAGQTEIYWDEIMVSSPLNFIAEYNTLQPSLSVHALTQPPGAVLAIYFLNIIFQSPGFVALGLAVLSGVMSAFFLQRIFRNFFAKEVTNYGVLMYLLLPAVQVYYLANVYALFATFLYGLMFCYLNENTKIKILGSIMFMFLGTFTSFLFVVVPLGLFIFEFLEGIRSSDNNGKGVLDQVGFNLRYLMLISLGTGAIYILLFLSLDFNYLSALSYASSSENPNGFMLFSKPDQYFITRLQDIMDIVVFLGPILIVLFVRGLHLYRTERATEHTTSSWYSLVQGFLIALLLLFLTGAPKKGETARICMFILPFMLISVLYLISEKRHSRWEMMGLLVTVFFQAVVMQLFGSYVW